jgi:hypothetical protein
MGIQMSWQIFIHSVRQVFGNMNGALRVSGVLFAAQIVITMTLGRTMLADPVAMQTQMLDGSFSWPLYALTMVLLLLLALWIAVGWHRYVLSNEQPAFVPKLYLDRVMGYFGKTLLIGLLVLPVALLFGMIVGFALGPLFQGQIMAQPFWAALIFGLLVYVPVGTVAMRLSAALPGVALQPGVSVFTGWRATEGHTFTIMGVVVISVLCSLVLTLPTLMLFAPLSVPALIWQFVTQWVSVMVGVSILTTLYGHYVEGRPLV